MIGEGELEEGVDDAGSDILSARLFGGILILSARLLGFCCVVVCDNAEE
jgi:hypothetical protein